MTSINLTLELPDTVASSAEAAGLLTPEAVVDLVERELWRREQPKPANDSAAENPLLQMAGLFSGGPGDTAERVDEVVADELNRKYPPRT